MKVLLASLLALGLISCEGSSPSDRADQAAVEEQQQVYQAAQPIPRFDYSRERAAAIQLYEARNRNVATHTVWRSDTGVIEGHCPSVGYPIPYDTSLTNPLHPVHHPNHATVAVEQPEPNGLYASHNSIATWVRCTVRVQGRRVVAPVYIESKVTTYPYPVEVDAAAGTVSPAGDHTPSVTIEDTRE